MKKYEIAYYKKLNGDRPARDWVLDQDSSIRANIYRKLDDLREEGTNLLHTKALDIITGPDNGFYELRNSGKG
jgi:hypothetical protein